MNARATAWIGLNEYLKPIAGETLVITATGAVASVASQLAKASGCNIVGIAGGQKCDYALESLDIMHVLIINLKIF